jgi:GTPase
MLIDDITINVKAGDGGDGAIAFNKNLMSLGPAGADGGDGGSVYFEGVSDLSALQQFKFKKKAIAPDGGIGMPQFRDGKDGENLVLRVPVGTVFTKIETGKIGEVVKIGQKVLVAKGGTGGKGNFKFRSSLRTTPNIAEPGTPGERFTLRVELKMIADVGIIGLPSAGKSSLLNEFTNAHSKVGNYPFTTLEPNLGVYYELILADIPGLIEGASKGKGLGDKFLRHIERTKVLFHLISAESDSPAADYKVIKKELKQYSPALAEKKEYLFLTKSDAVMPEALKKKLAAIKKIDKKAMAISIYDFDSMEKVKKLLNEIKAAK